MLESPLPSEKMVKMVTVATEKKILKCKIFVSFSVFQNKLQRLLENNLTKTEKGSVLMKGLFPATSLNESYPDPPKDEETVNESSCEQCGTSSQWC